MPTVKHKRGTRAAMNALRDAGTLVPWQIYCLTDEGGRICVATSTGAYYETAPATAWPYLVVSRNAGDDGGFQFIGAAFTTIEINSVQLDTHGGWDAAAFNYIVPQSGVYDCSAKMRSTDNTGAVSQGLGIDIANRDSASFVWDSFPNNAPQNRKVLQNRRVFQINAGERVRIFGYDARSLNKAELVLQRIM